MSRTIREIYNTLSMKTSEEEKILSRKIYIDEVRFESRLDDEMIKEFRELRANKYNLNCLLEENAFEMGFYYSYWLINEMKDGAKEYIRMPDHLSLN